MKTPYMGVFLFSNTIPHMEHMMKNIAKEIKNPNIHLWKNIFS